MSPVIAFVVEDSPVILDNLVAALEEMAPVKVVGSADGEAGAVQWLLEPGHACDLVIIDLFLKSGSGLGVLRSAAQNHIGGKRVVLTNHATPDMRARCAQLGAHRVFDKSREFDELVAYCAALSQEGGANGSAGPTTLN